MKTSERWSDEEVDILKSYGNKITIYELSEKLVNRSVISIRAKRNRLGIILDDEYLSNLGKYARSKVNPDNLCKLDQRIKLNEIDGNVKQILLGCLLGDGCVKKNGSDKNKKFTIRNFAFYCCHYKKQIPYCEWKSKELKMFMPKNRNYLRGGIHDILEFITVSHPIFTYLRESVYVENKKNIVTDYIINNLDLFGFLIWYLDDGCPQKQRHKCFPRISCKGYSEESLKKFCSSFNDKYNLSLKIQKSKHRDGENKTISIPAKDRDFLFPIWNNFFEKYKIPKYMKYKIENAQT